MENETITVPGQDAAVEPASTETQTTTQVVSEPQKLNAGKVDAGDNQPQKTEPQRVRPSDFFREREKYRRLEEAQHLTQKRLDEIAEFLKPKPEIQSEQPFNKDQFFLEPETFLKSREQRILSEMAQLKQEIAGFKNQQINVEKMNDEREALEMLFPKSSPDAEESLEERMQNLDRREMLEKFFYAHPGLDRLMRMSPKEAAELALLKLGQSKPAASPNAIKKTLMGPTARGNPSGGTKVQNTIEAKVSELKMLSDEAKEKPQLRFDPDFNKKKADLNREINRLLKEEGNNK